jgi:hypothetical protein
MGRLLVVFGLFVSLSAQAADSISRIRASGIDIDSGPDGSIFVLGFGQLTATTNAWIARPRTPQGDFYVARMNPKTNEFLYVTYLNFRPEALAVDSRGAAVVVGETGQPFTTLPNAYQSVRKGISDAVIIRLNPAGTALEVGTLLGGTDTVTQAQIASGAAVPDRAVDVGIGPDGSIYVAGETPATDFPTTANAYQRQLRSKKNRESYFARLSADGTSLLYSSFLGGTGRNAAARLAVSSSGDAYFAVVTDSTDFPQTAEAAHFPPEAPILYRTYAVKWNAGTATYDYVTLAGEPASNDLFTARDAGSEPVYITVDSNRRAIVGYRTIARDRVTSSGRAARISRVNFDGTALEYTATYGDGSTVDALYSAPDGTVVFAGSSGFAFPVTVKAYQRAGSAYVARFDPASSNLVYATKLQAAAGEPATTVAGLNVSGSAIQVLLHFDVTSGGSTVPAVDPSTVSDLGPAPTDYQFYGSPKTIESCNGNGFARSVLSWDIRDARVKKAELHFGAPDGELLTDGVSGVMSVVVSGAQKYYLQDVTDGRPLTAGNTIAIEELGTMTTSSCGMVDGPSGFLSFTSSRALSASQPILSCLDGSDPTTIVYGQGLFQEGDNRGANSTQIHVLSPDGPLFASTGPNTFQVTGATRGWLRSGQPFYLTRLVEGGTPRLVAADRVYLLPADDCSKPMGTLALVAAINATPDTALAGQTWLAWHSASTNQVEIRQGGRDGVAVARFDTTLGIFPVPSGTGRETYYLMEYRGGNWVQLGFASVGTFPF